MIERTIVFPSLRSKEASRRALAAIGLVPESNQAYERWMSHGIVIEDDAELVDRIIAVLGSAGPAPFVRRDLVFSRSEIEGALLATVHVSSSLTQAIPEPKFDLGAACPKCGAGAVQVSALRLPERALARKSGVLQTMARYVVVSADVREAILAAVPECGASLRQVEEKRTRALLPWWQVLPTKVLPPLAPESSGVVRENPCSACDRDGYFHAADRPFRLAYSRRTLNAAGDLEQVQAMTMAVPLAYTPEIFGNSTLEAPGTPHLVAGGAVIRALLRLRLRGLQFTPVLIVE